MTLSAWSLPVLAVPVLWLGQWLVNRVRVLQRLDLPPAIVGGFLIAIVVLCINTLGHTPIKFETKVASLAWQGLVTPETQWKTAAPQYIYLPFSTAFFASVGLCASWNLVRRGSWQLLLLLGIATLLGAIQNWIGIAIAKAMGAPSLLGVICGSLTLTGGPSTALGMADEFEKAGFHGAAVVGTAAAMFGIVTASLMAGAVGGQIVRSFKLRQPLILTQAVDSHHKPTAGIFGSLEALRQPGANVGLTIFILILCIKAGTWVSFGWHLLASHFHWTLNFPVYMGALLTAIVVCNGLELLGINVLRTPTIEAIAGIVLRLFLAMAIVSLNLLDLRAVAGPMLVILLVQVVVTILFCVLITYPLMGRDYDAAVMATGHVGFGLGITPNAVASMDNLIDKFGPAPRALLVATIVGAFLIDITNAFLITFQLNHYAH